MRQDQITDRRGFTLVETMVVIVLVAMLLGIGLPRFQEQRARYWLDTAAHQLAGDLRRAQVEAIKSNRTIELATTGAYSYNIQSVPTVAVPLVTVFNTRTFEGGVSFAVGSATTARMASFGPPTAGGSVFIVERNGAQKTVRVSAAGLITVQ